MPTVGPNPTFHPLGPPVISGTEITVDLMLQQPTRITQMLMDLTLQRFFVDRIFTNGGGVTGGAVIFDQATENDLYLSDDIERVAPGAEFPVVGDERRAPKIATPEKWGAKWYFTDEARDRNDNVAFVNKTRRAANTIVRKINQRGVEVLDAAIAGNAGNSEFVGHNWGTAVPNGSNPTPPASTPAADFAMPNLIAEQRELGIYFDGWIVNPLQMHVLRLFYGDKLSQVLADNGITDLYSSMRVAPGTAYVYASGQVGQMRIESPLRTITEREGAPLMRERTWVQSSVRPLFFVDNPFAVLKITGLQG